MRVYVAGSSAELPSIRKLMSQIRAWGHEIAYDWPAVIAEMGVANEGLSPVIALTVAKDASVAVCEADVLVLVAPTEPTLSGGCFLEVGVAITSDVPVLVFGHWPSVFSAFCDTCSTDADVRRWLADQSRAAEVA